MGEPEPGPAYVHGHHPSVLRSYAVRTAENSAQYLMARLQSGQSLLDVGCGAGSITCDLAALVAPGLVTGIDTSREALDQAADLVAERGLGNVELRLGDGHDLDFADGRISAGWLRWAESPDGWFAILHGEILCTA